MGVRCNAIMRAEDYRKKQISSYFSKKGGEEEMAQEESELASLKKMVRNELQEKGKYFCPICSQDIDCKGNIAVFNRHIDKCLNASGPKQMVTEDRSSPSTGKKVPRANSVAEKIKKSKEKSGLMTFLRKKE